STPGAGCRAAGAGTVLRGAPRPRRRGTLRCTVGPAPRAPSPATGAGLPPVLRCTGGGSRGRPGLSGISTTVPSSGCGSGLVHATGGCPAASRPAPSATRWTGVLPAGGGGASGPGDGAKCTTGRPGAAVARVSGPPAVPPVATVDVPAAGSPVDEARATVASPPPSPSTTPDHDDALTRCDIRPVRPMSRPVAVQPAAVPSWTGVMGAMVRCRGSWNAQPLGLGAGRAGAVRRVA